MSRQTINRFLKEELKGLKIAVLGDIMLDRYIYGKVNRISPEAPVPVNKVTHMRTTLGGAANVASNLSHLECQVYLMGLIGEDTFGKELVALLQDSSIKNDYVIVDDSYGTITKVRILDTRQQMLRLDYEEIQDMAHHHELKILEGLEALCKEGLQGIVISDYGKGFFTDSLTKAVIALAKKYHILTVVDPKGTEWDKYGGADFITPNVKEVATFLHREVPNYDSCIKEAAFAIKEKISIANIVVTRSEKGITLLNDTGVWHSPAIERGVFDVSGAGDTVVAMLIASIASKLSIREALWLCNVAASVVVAKLGTYPIHRSELIEEWEVYLHSQSQDSGICTKEMMKGMIDGWKNHGETVVFTNGCFDILHRGHIEYLKEASRLGHRFVIAVNSDASVSRLKGVTRPINNENDRAYILANLAFVDGVVIFEEDTPRELLAFLRPHILVKGGDYALEDVIGREYVEDVKIIPFKEGYSTTAIVKKILGK